MVADKRCLKRIQLVLFFHEEAIVPQLEKISLDQCQLSLFPNLHNSPPRLTPPDEAEALDYYEGLLAKSEGTTLDFCKVAATMHCLAMD